MRFILFLLAVSAWAQPYDLLLKNGRVIDAKNNVDAVRDVAIAGGKIAKVAANIPATDAKKVADVSGLYVTPGLIDIHVHVYAGTGQKALTGDTSVYPDGFTFRTGVTTVVDAGSSGWKNFADFRQRVIDRAKTRVFAMINIVDNGMSPTGENDPATMLAEEAAKVAKANADVVVGFKTAHYSGPAWFAVDRAVEAGKLTNLPVMVDFGQVTKERVLSTLLEDKLRPGDIYTHMYSGHRDELLNGKTNPAMVNGRKRGVLFDVGHGGASFYWNIAIPMAEQGFLPDIISTDLHGGSMNAGMKDMPTTMSKVLSLGVSFKDVIRMSTWEPAKAIHHPELGSLTEGSEADVTVLRLADGNFGLIDGAGAKRDVKQKIQPELTIRKGAVVWDLNGLAAQDWKTFQYRQRPRPQ